MNIFKSMTWKSRAAASQIFHPLALNKNFGGLFVWYVDAEVVNGSIPAYGAVLHIFSPEPCIWPNS